MAEHSTKRPEPVLTRAALVSVLGVLSALLVQLGAGDVSTWLDAHSEWIAGAILAAAPTVSGWLARRHVTPKESPRNDAGEKLAPVGSAPVVLDAAVALAEAEEIHPAG